MPHANGLRQRKERQTGKVQLTMIGSHYEIPFRDMEDRRVENKK